MQIINLKKEPLNYTGIAPITIYEQIAGYSPKIQSESEFTRFFFSLNPLELITNGTKQFVTERSAIKINPETNIGFNIEKGAAIYEMQLLKSEKETLEALTKNNKSFFAELTGVDKEEWDKVCNQEPDHIIESERNSQHIQKLPGALIAPPYSRFKNNSGSGWNIMYARGSRSFGIASDMEFGVRGEEIMHIHKITSEMYLCLGGGVELEISGNRYALKPSDILIAEPNEAHTKITLTETPYKGLTLQLPSIPGDKYTVEGVRTR